MGSQTRRLRVKARSQKPKPLPPELRHLNVYPPASMTFADKLPELALADHSNDVEALRQELLHLFEPERLATRDAVFAHLADDISAIAASSEQSREQVAGSLERVLFAVAAKEDFRRGVHPLLRGFAKTDWRACK